MTKADYDNLTSQGLDVETVGDLLGGHGDAPVEPVYPPRLEGQPPFPAAGIYFGMPEEVYHAIHAASTSGLKTFAASPADYWEDSVLNPEREERESRDYFDYGKAIHCLVLEGEEVYAARYVIGLEKPEGVIENVDQIKTAIAKLGEKPVTRVDERAAKKEDWIAQLLELDPEAQVWERMQAAFDAEHAGAEIVSHKIDKRVRIATKMILGQPDIAALFSGGYPEVSIFWFCPVTGCPMKARLDYLTATAIVDLKSFSSKGNLPIDRAVEREIANHRYNVQHVIYDEAAAMARQMIREKGEFVIHSNMNTPATLSPDARSVIVDWCVKWAKQPDEPDFIFVFQKSTKAPVVRGKIMPRESMGVFGTTRRRVEELKRSFVAHCEVYGTGPWLDIQPVSHIGDTDLPMWATEI